MRIKINYLLAFYIFLIACSGIKLDLLSISLLILTPIVTFLITDKLGLISSKSTGFDIFKSIKYFFWLIREIVFSSIAVSKIAWRKNPITYQVIEPVISSQNTKIGRVIYANSITLTPGTVTLNIEGNNLLVHALDLKFMEDLQEGTMDSKVHECFKKHNRS